MEILFAISYFLASDGFSHQRPSLSCYERLLRRFMEGLLKLPGTDAASPGYYWTGLKTRFPFGESLGGCAWQRKLGPKKDLFPALERNMHTTSQVLSVVLPNCSSVNSRHRRLLEGPSSPSQFSPCYSVDPTLRHLSGTSTCTNEIRTEKKAATGSPAIAKYTRNWLRAQSIHP